MKPRSDVILTDVGGESILVPVGKLAVSMHGVVRLNETGREIWQGLTEGLDENAIAERLAERYEVDEAKARKDVAAAVEKLRAAGVLE